MKVNVVIKFFLKECTIVIFGSKGDLAKRKLIPSLYRLEVKDKLSRKTKIIALGRANWKNSEYRTIVELSLKNFFPNSLDTKILERFKKRFYFYYLDVYNSINFLHLKRVLDEKRLTIYYLAMSSETFKAIVIGLKNNFLNFKNSRIVLEKPLGSSLESSKKINVVLGKYFNESQIFRIDHYLAKETVLNLLYLRFSNVIFLNSWNKFSIDNVQITVSEKLGVEDRVKFFNKTGQIRDMVQSHLLQILALVTMSPPIRLDSNEIRKEKVKILKNLKQITENEIRKKVVIGQYGSGKINGDSVQSYLNSLGDNKKSNTETFFAVKVEINNENWEGVPFYLRTGKRLKEKRSEIIINFKDSFLNLFKNKFPKDFCNSLVITLQPNEGIKINFFNRRVGYNNDNLDKKTFSFSYKNEYHLFLDDYERLLAHIIKGDQSLFLHREEVENSWKWVDSIINSLKKRKIKPIIYDSGSWGPVESQSLLEKENRKWNF